MKENKYKVTQPLVSLVHFLLIVAAWSSPFWLEWRLIVVGVLLLYVLYFFSGGCPLTFIEAGRDKYQTFYYYHLVKLFPRLSKYHTYIAVRFVLPGLIIGLALLLQLYFGIEPPAQLR